MSKEDLERFVHSAEHSIKLREELRECKNYEQIIVLAATYGFHLIPKDFETDKTNERIQNWFKISKIKPIRTNPD